MTKVCAALVALAAAVAALVYFTRRRQEPAPGDLRNLLKQIRCDLKVQRRAIYDSRSVLNDAHKLIHAVSKGLKKQPS